MTPSAAPERATRHATFTIERIYPASPARVFAAWTSVEAKANWFYCDAEWKPALHEMDFRVGGYERIRTGPAGGTAHIFDGRYYDIAPDRRIVYAFDMHLDDRRISVSLATVQLEPAGTGTRLIFTEQVAFLDGYDDLAGREEGTRIGLENLDATLRRERAAA